MKENILRVVIKLSLLLFFASCSSHGAGHARHERIPIDSVGFSDTVWICDSDGAKRFHASDTCGGILSCGEEIVTLTRSEAEDMGRSYCHRCYY